VISPSCRLLGRGINLDITDAGRTVVEMICEKMTILDDEREREVDTRVAKEVQNLHLQAR
jgi:ribosome-associated translation inhibitor RaiA